MATQYFLIIIGLQFQWLEFHIKIHGMAGKQCAFSDQKAGKRSLFSETWAGISTSTQWTPCLRMLLCSKVDYNAECRSLIFRCAN